MDRRTFLRGLAAGSLGEVTVAVAQPTAKSYRVGVVLEGGPYYASVDGLKAGLKELGLEEGKQYVLVIRDVKGDTDAIGEAARKLEEEKVDLICTTATSVTRPVERATKKVPIIFYTGSDPVRNSLIKSFARPGGRLTGVYTRGGELAAKRLQILKEAVPKVRRVFCFFSPGRRGATEGVSATREAAPQLRIEVVERHVRSVDELRASLQGLKAAEGDAIFLVPDVMVHSQARLIVEAARTKKLPTMFYERTSVIEGGLASYGVSYYAVGRLTARYVQRVLQGASPAELPVEGFDRFELVVNLKTARALGLTIPQSILGRADEVIQ